MRRGLSLLVLAVLVVSTARADDWPQWLGPQRDGVWRETGIIDQIPAGGLKAKWRTPIGAGYAGPAVANGKVYVADRILADGADNPKSAFARDLVKGVERVLCLDEATGKILWKHEYKSNYQISYAAGPRCTPVVRDGKVWTVGAMGDLFCLDASTGKEIWSKNFIRDYAAKVPVWGFAGHPLLDGNKLIVLAGGDNALVVALDKDTGKEIWKALAAKEPGYSPPMIYTINGKRQLIVWHPEAVCGLDPETGKVLWTYDWEVGAALTAPTPRAEGDKVLLVSFYNGATMLEIKGDAAKELWKSKWHTGKKDGERPNKSDNLHSIMPTPIWKDGHIYGVCSYGELRCLNPATGERIWESLQLTGSTKSGADRWNNAFIVEHADRFFFFTEKGDLVIGKLSPQGYEEIGRANILKPDNKMAGRLVVWSHPAFANKAIYARNDSEIICVPLAK